MKTLALMLALFCATGIAKAAPPTLGADCGIGTTITGSKNAGKITLGAPPVAGYFLSCTLGFSWPKEPSCTANLEGSVLDPTVDPGVYATESTTTTLRISNERGSLPPMDTGYVISYLCVGQ